MRKCVRWRWVGEVICWNVNRMEGSDRSLVGRSNALLQVAHLRSERRLITNGGWRTAEQRRHFRPGLGKSEDVINEKQHILIAFVAEIFRHRQRGESHAQT